MNVTDIVMDGPLAVATMLAVAAGLASFLSPCVLPLVPGYLSYVATVTGSRHATQQAGPAVGVVGSSGAVATAQPTTANTSGDLRIVIGALLFVAGFASVFTSYGLLFGALGSLLITHQQALVQVLGVATIVVGLIFSGVLGRIPFANRSFRVGHKPRLGLAGAPMLGVMFGLGWTPCIGPTLAAVLTLATTSAGAGRGAFLSLAYSLGLGIPFVVTAFSLTKMMKRLAWARRHAVGLMRVGGLAMVILGLLQVSGLWLDLMTRFQGVVANWQTPV